MGKECLPLMEAVERLNRHGLSILNASSVYLTPPWGKTDQSDFFNMVVEVGFDGGPDDLLRTAMELEREMGRVRTVQWGPRIIDIDLLAFGSTVLSSQRLTIPHPMLAQRAFVLLPWAEIASGFEVPGFQATVSELLSRLSPQEIQAIQRVNCE
ncbi:MAG: hypothetical protein RLZZ165_1767 [Bacteroidota bacterium]